MFHALLAEPHLLDYDTLYIYTTTTEQSAYQFLEHGFSNNLNRGAISYLFKEYENDKSIDMTIKDFCENFKNEPEFTDTEKNKVTVHLSSKAVPMPDDLNRKKKNLVIFDDCVTKKDQMYQREYFTRGRHNNCTVFYLTQRYYEVPKIIRDNANVIILFKQPQKLLTLLFNEIDAQNSDSIKRMANGAWNSRHGYIALNLSLIHI